MLAAIEVWAAFATPRDMIMPPWIRIVLPVVFAASAYKHPRRDRAAIVVLGAIMLFALNRDLIGNPALVHILVLAGCAYVAVSGLQAGRGSSFTARYAMLAILMVVGAVLVILFLPLS